MILSCRKKSFTLAEVLVTLGIIGVIAAMTIPSLIKSFEEKSNNTKAKKAYSAISSAWNQYRSDKGGNVVGTFTDRFSLKDEFLKSQFSYIKETSPGINVYTYQRLYSYDNNSINSGIITLDGIFIGIANTDGNCNLQGYSDYCSQVLIDVNASKGPNKMGYDVFYISLTKNRIVPHDVRYAQDHARNTSCIEPENTGWDAWENDGVGCLNRILQNKPKWSG